MNVSVGGGGLADVAEGAEAVGRVTCQCNLTLPNPRCAFLVIQALLVYTQEIIAIFLYVKFL